MRQLPTWFLFLNGFALLLLGSMMLRIRLRNQEGISGWRRGVGMIWSALCIGMGILLLCMGFHIVPQPVEWMVAKRSA